MVTPDIYRRIKPSRIPGLFFSWMADVQRGLPLSADDDPVVLRDENGNPLERWAVIYTALPTAVCPPSAQDVELFQQQGETLSATLYVRKDPGTLILPDIRVRDRIRFPTAGDRYFVVLTSVDVGEAGLLRELRVSERQPYPTD